MADPRFFRGGVANSKDGFEKLLFGQFSPQKSSRMKLKEFGPREGGGGGWERTRPWRPL